MGISSLIDKNKPFAFIRLPKEQKIYVIKEDEEGENIYIFRSFDNTKEYQFKFRAFEEVDYEERIESEFCLAETGNKDIIAKKEYINLLEKTIRFLKEGKAEKVVISREKWIENEKINPLKSFIKLCGKYPLSFCHLSFWNKEECWLGATPEVLGTYENEKFQTMSLAGTLPDDKAHQWKEKEQEEQAIVTRYINEKLGKYSEEIKLEGPETLHLGHIKHLVTYFTVKLNNEECISDLINDLHPTPAVCGLPLEESKIFILKEEGYDRDFYAGYIGLKTENYQKYFVNLRCGKLYKEGALLFVGGGITAHSNPETEWEETELKSRFIGECL